MVKNDQFTETTEAFCLLLKVLFGHAGNCGCTTFAATRHSALIILFVELHFSDMDVSILRNYIYNTMFHYTVLRLDMGK